ncbi:MAG TPA: hypothetical protein VGN57_05030 [Pirellulaceae bacterium]|jgi:hypothetical protein|nr:hypothetical protein [Pirellulaceae bacterium]
MRPSLIVLLFAIVPLGGLFAEESEAHRAAVEHFRKTHFSGLSHGRIALGHVGLHVSMTEEDWRHLRNVEGLTELWLSLPDFRDEDLVHLKGLKELESLDLHSTSVRGPGLSHLQALPKLTRLGLSRVTDDDGLSHVAELMELTELRVPAKGVTDAGMVHVARLTSLETLDLGGPAIGAPGLAALAPLQKLRKLTLGTGVGETLLIDAAGIEHIARLTALETIYLEHVAVEDLGPLQELPKLRRIMLQGGSIDEGGLDDLHAFPALQELSIWYTASIGGKEIAQIARAKGLELFELPGWSGPGAELAPLAKLQNLKRLNLDRAKNADAAAVHLAKIDSLRDLRLQLSDLSDAGLVLLARLPNLEKLDIDRTYVTDASVDAILQMKSLRSLDPVQRGMTQKGFDRLRAEAPTLDVAIDAPP